MKKIAPYVKSARLVTLVTERSADNVRKHQGLFVIKKIFHFRWLQMVSFFRAAIKLFLAFAILPLLVLEAIMVDMFVPLNARSVMKDRVVEVVVWDIIELILFVRRAPVSWSRELL